MAIERSMQDKKINAFIQTLAEWYGQHRRQLPFRDSADPYKIWVSEVLLQQTQVSRGVKYYERFITRFPTVSDLAAASWEEFLTYFEGLGYYSRGRNMLKTARIITGQYGGRFPDTGEALRALPGIGGYTADAILSFAFGKPTVPLDTNLKRVLGRVFLGTSSLDEKAGEAQDLLGALTRGYQATSSATINQAMMDFGSAVCFATKPLCMFCPLRQHCAYFQRELPYNVSKRRAAPKDYTAKCPMAVIIHDRTVLLFGETLLGGLLDRRSERDFLKDLAKQRLGLDLSVRPAYKAWVENGIKYSLHRCLILRGEEGLGKLRPRVITEDEVTQHLVTHITPLPSSQAEHRDAPERGMNLSLW